MESSAACSETAAEVIGNRLDFEWQHLPMRQSNRADTIVARRRQSGMVAGFSRGRRGLRANY